MAFPLINREQISMQKQPFPWISKTRKGKITVLSLSTSADRNVFHTHSSLCIIVKKIGIFDYHFQQVVNFRAKSSNQLFLFPESASNLYDRKHLEIKKLFLHRTKQFSSSKAHQAIYLSWNTFFLLGIWMRS